MRERQVFGGTRGLVVGSVSGVDVRKNTDKIMAHSITKELSITIDELIDFAKEINLKIKSGQTLLLPEEVERLMKHIEKMKQKLYFDSSEWSNHSSIDGFQNLIIFIEQTLSTIDAQIVQNSDILNHSNHAYKELQHLHMENGDLIEIKIYLLSKFDFSLENLKDKLIFMKSEALEQLDKVESSVSIWEDEALSKKEINFNFSATKIVRLYEEQMKKIDNFSKVDRFFSELVKAIKIVQKTDEIFKTTDRDRLENILKDSYMEAYLESLYAEWHSEIDKINRFYLKGIQAYFTGKISDNMVLDIFTILHSIKKDLEDFYLTIRSGLAIKYKDNPKSELLQEVATKERVFKIYQNAQPKFIALLQNEKSQVAYRFLNTLLSDLIDFKIEEKSEGYEEIYEKMAQIHSVNLEIYLNDIEMYGKELEKKDLEISKLMFKMKTDLEKEKE